MIMKKRLVRALTVTLSIAMLGVGLKTSGMMVHAQQVTSQTAKSVVITNIDFDKEINLSSYDYSNIKKISVKFGGAANQFNGAVVFGNWSAQESYTQNECTNKTFTFDVKNPQPFITIKTWWSDAAFSLESVTLLYNEESGSSDIQPTVEPTKEPTVEPTKEPTVEPTKVPSTQAPQNNNVLADGWYYIKNVHAQKYVTVADNKGTAGQNVELRTKNGADGQKWYVKNIENGYVTLKTALGDFMIDVAYGSADNEANIGIYNGYSGDAQQFKLLSATTENEFYIATKVSSDNSVLDDARKSTAEGANVIQYRYNGNANQRFMFEKVGTQNEQPGTQTPTNKPLSQISKGNQATNVSVHDPSIVEANGMFYFFGSHMAAAKSSNLKNFTLFADGVNANNRLFSNLFTGNMGAFSYTGKNVDGGYAVWAPDVIWNKDMRKWTMYFCTSHDWRTSSLCMAVADNIEGPYTYTNTLLCSGFTASTVQKTNFYEVMGRNANVSAYLSNGQYNYKKYPNCIDPSVFYDKNGKLWMTYGSWSGGIYMLELNRYTGLPIHPQTNESKQVDKYFGYHLIGGNHKSCEGPYIIYDNTTDYYYLFVSYGELTRTGGYQIRQFRSKNVTGPYTDIKGQTLGSVSDHKGYGVKMMGNYSLPSLRTSYMAPGHNSAIKASDGKYYLAYHQRMDNGTEYHEVRVHQMFLNEDGWFVAAPFAYADEKLANSWTKKPHEWCGTLYGVNHGTDISGTIQPYKEWTFETNNTFKTPDGVWGTYQIKDSYITMKAGNDTYSGVIGQMKDEAGNEVVFISAVNNKNETVWIVKYL